MNLLERQCNTLFVDSSSFRSRKNMVNIANVTLFWSGVEIERDWSAAQKVLRPLLVAALVLLPEAILFLRSIVLDTV
jgi:hypothetical protein